MMSPVVMSEVPVTIEYHPMSTASTAMTAVTITAQVDPSADPVPSVADPHVADPPTPQRLVGRPIAHGARHRDLTPRRARMTSTGAPINAVTTPTGNSAEAAMRARMSVASISATATSSPSPSAFSALGSRIAIASPTAMNGSTAQRSTNVRPYREPAFQNRTRSNTAGFSSEIA